MSIYATLWILKFPADGDAHSRTEWVSIVGQGVPGHIGHPEEGYESDPYPFLPPVPEDSESLRAVVIVREGTPKDGQEYTSPLLVLSGAAYGTMPFQELHDRICEALRSGRPRLIAEVIDADGERELVYEESPERS
jgi:hypothetical protein